MNFFEQQLRHFTGKTTAFKSDRAIYAGRACFIALCGGRTARLEFVTSGHSGHYDALQITILANTEGKIDCLRLRFIDHFSRRNTIPYIWEDGNEIDWYTAPTTSEILQLAQTAHDYIDLFT